MNRTKLDGRGYSCLECQREYTRQHYRKNTKYYKDKAEKHKQVARNWYQQFKSTLRCRCGESHPGCLHFHHLDPKKKSVNVSAVIHRWSRDRVLAEMAKCNVLCSNCHGKLHWDERCPSGVAEAFDASNVAVPGSIPGRGTVIDDFPAGVKATHRPSELEDQGSIPWRGTVETKRWRVGTIRRTRGTSASRRLSLT